MSRPQEVDFREVINAVRYLVCSGCGWRMQPVGFGACDTVYGWFRELARHTVRLAPGRPTTGISATSRSRLRKPKQVGAPPSRRLSAEAPHRRRFSWPAVMVNITLPIFDSVELSGSG
ncbi:transposase [Mesorhizobium sp. NZP2234]|nr:transposase [Mesorhizobium sp. NZP2234]